MNTATKTADEIVENEMEKIKANHISEIPEQPTGILLKVRDIQESTPALQVFMSERIKPSSAFRLKAVIRQINIVMGEFEKGRLALCQEYGTLNAETLNYDIPEEKQAEFNEKIQEMFETEIHLPVKPLKLVELGDIRISADVLMMLDWLIVEK